MLIGDLFQEARDLVDASSVSYPDVKLLRRANNAMEDVVADLINGDGTWEFDDTNYTSLPIGTADLVAGQAAYTFDGDFLEIMNVKVQNVGGLWFIMHPWDQSEHSTPLETLLLTPAMPTMYQKVANTITLIHPPAASAVTLTGGLKVQFKRTAYLFQIADIAANTLSPGFASPFHMLIALKAALPYAMSYKKDRVPGIQSEITRLHAGLMAHYGSREKDKPKVMRTKPISHR